MERGVIRMTNKEKIKLIMNEEFDMKKNYNEIINKIKRRNMIKKNVKYIVVPVCFVFIFAIVINFGKNFQKIFETSEYNKNNIITSENKNIININKIDNIDKSIEDIGGSAVDLSRDELITEQPFVSKINIPKYLNENRFIKMFDLKNNLKGYNLFYIDENDLNRIDIFFSKTLKRRERCFQIIEEDMKLSTIKDVNLIIINLDDYYNVLFEYNNLYFDIEMYDMTQEEVITVIESIINK